MPDYRQNGFKNVDGVTDASAKCKGNGYGWAKGTYDDDKTGVEELTFATEMAGSNRCSNAEKPRLSTADSLDIYREQELYG